MPQRIERALTSGARIPCLRVGIVVSMTADRTGTVMSKLKDVKCEGSPLHLIGYRLCKK